jgi:hypothetical protein
MVPQEVFRQLAKQETPKFTYNIFFSKKFGSHIQVHAEDLDTLKSDVAEVEAYLEEAGATPQNRDKTFTPPSPKQEADMDAAADKIFGAKPVQSYEKLCQNDGTPMSYKPGGISKDKVDKNGNPKKFNSRYQCPTCQMVVWNKD